MKLTPTVSIIIPIYNVESYLSKMIDSVLAQDFYDFELICVDDGSTDSSGKICDEYALKDPRVKVIHQRNTGVAIARNNGYKQIRGKYIIFLDSDDYLESNAIRLMHNKAEADDSDVTMCSVKYNYNNHVNTIDISNNQDNIQYLKAMLNDSLPIALWNKLIKTDFCKKHNIKFLDKINYGEDMIYTILLFANNPKVSIVKDALYEYYIRDNSSTATLLKNKKKLDQYLKSLSIITDILTTNNISINDIIDKKKAIAKVLAIESGLYTKEEIVYLFLKETKRYIRSNNKIDFAIQLSLVKLGFFQEARLLGKIKRLIRNFLYSK